MSTHLRPIEAHEVPHLQRLGRAVHELRMAAGVSQRKLAWLAQLGDSQYRAIETGTRRTRRATLERIVGALADVDGDLDAAGVLEDLVELAGPALAPPSQYQARVDQRRERRTKKQDAIEVRARELAARMLAAELAARRVPAPNARERRQLRGDAVASSAERKARASRRDGGGR